MFWRYEVSEAQARRSGGLSGRRRNEVKTSRWQKVKTFVHNALREPSYVIPLIVIVLIWAFFRAYVVPSGSMIPTLVEGDRIIGVQQYAVNGHTFHAGDIVTFLSDEGTVYVKRVVAEGGDDVLINGDTLYVNGEESPYQGTGTGAIQGEWKLDDDEYFCMGDNRGNSKDSRYIGPIKANRMIAKVINIYFPFNRIRWLAGGN